MDIQLLGDESIHDYRHATVVFDDTKQSAKLLPGESEGMVYLGVEAVHSHKDLAAYNRITVGETKLMYVPFCGERHQWTEQ